MGQTQKRGFDYTTVLLLLVVAATFICMFISPVEAPDFDWDAAKGPVHVYFHNVYLECALTGIDEDYAGEFLVIERQYKKAGEDYKLASIRDNMLTGSNIRHILMQRLPETIEPNAFAGVEGVIVYTDQTITEDMEWAQYVAIQPEEDFYELVNPGKSYRFEFSAAQLWTSIQNWAGDMKTFLGTSVALSLVMFLLCFLRQKNGRGNPLWPIFRSGIGKWLFVAFSYAVGLVTAVALFCEEADIGMDVYVVTEFLTGWPLIVLAVFGGLFLFKDLFSKDFPWFIARWVVRAAITGLVIAFCAIVAWVVATIVSENLAMFRVLYILGLALFVSGFVGGSGKANSGIMSRMESSTVIAEDGSSRRVDHYSHGTYVGNDQIVGFGSDTMTGASGQVYKKY